MQGQAERCMHLASRCFLDPYGSSACSQGFYIPTHLQGMLPAAPSAMRSRSDSTCGSGCRATRKPGLLPPAAGAGEAVRGQST